MNKMKRTIVAAAAAATLAFTGIAWAADAQADPGCETVLWGFFGSQRRTLCDGPILGNGGWERARVVWVPAHQVPFRCTYSRYSSSCSGGYFVDESIVSAEKYIVLPENVLPDEPGHLA